MSLTEALRAGEPEVFGLLYDEHGPRIHAYCHRMVGDEAADAARDAFAAAARHRAGAPSDDDALPLWLHALARAEVLRRGALAHAVAADPMAPPLERALARLRPEHRDALALADALDVEGLARITGVADDTAELLVRMAGRRLEQAVVTVLEAGAEADDELLTALAKGRLPALVSRRVPGPPASLREDVVAASAAAERATAGVPLSDADGLPLSIEGAFGTADAATGHHARRTRPETAAAARHRRRPHRRNALLTETLTLAACAAAVVGAILVWPAGPGQGVSHVGDNSRLVRHGTPTSRPSSPGDAGTLGDGSSRAGGSRTAPKTAAASPSASATRASSSPTPTASRPPASPSSPTPSGTPTPSPTTSAPTPTPTPTPSLSTLPLPVSVGGSPSATPTPKTS
ncbi:sigma factor [Actinoallomurus soli]|uniref:sigma factor n=1 Tax=Actinoallomurus soli TaxID=2952535 RepID=UPI002092DEFF|nr:sigma factor [Actinoallomurus soli]MCO5973305.1 hypothetical protein [Actinoallomurus soli]